MSELREWCDSAQHKLVSECAAAEKKAGGKEQVDFCRKMMKTSAHVTYGSS